MRTFALYGALILSGALGGGNALAVVLDAITEQSLLGEPLRVVIPLDVRPNETLAGDCVHIVRSRVTGNDGVPELGAARITLEQTEGSRRLVITTQQPVNDLAIRVTVQADCETAITREYLILLDPPVVETPKSSVAARTMSFPTAAIEAPVATALPEAPVATAIFEAPAAPASLSATSEPAEPSTLLAQPVAITREHESVAPATARKSATANKSSRARLSSERRLSVLDKGSRLEISRTLKTGGPDGLASTATFDSLSKSAQLAAVEEQEVVLRKRVEELSIQVARMQQERIAELTATVERLQQDLHAAEAAKRAAETATSQTPWAQIWRWITESWLMAVAATLLAALGTAISVWRAHRITRSALRPGEAPLVASAPNTMSPVIDEENPLFVGPYTARRRGTKAAAMKNQGNEIPPQSPASDAAFDHDIAARREITA